MRNVGWCRAALAALTLVVLGGCADGTGPKRPFTVVATVVAGPEHCLSLATEREWYLPRELPAAFREPGLRVRVTAVREPFFNNCGAANGIRILQIDLAPE